MAQDNNRVQFTQSISKAARIRFVEVESNFSKMAISHDLIRPQMGEILDKLIMKFGEQLTYEDFFPEKFKGNELK